jgi:dienelactone hydrolase
MKRLTQTLCLVATLVPASAGAQTIVREELRVPMAGAGPRGLEGLLVRPNEAGKFPLVLLNHGAPRDPKDRPGMTPLTYAPHALEFARRGFAALVVMRRGYGDSGSTYAESNGPCDNPDYVRSGTASRTDLRAAIAYAATRSDVDATRVVSVGQSAGGFATVALTADPPPGLTAAISFAGGRGSPGPDQVCRDERLVGAFGTFGKTSRVPMLWVYGDNDHFFGPALAQKFRAAFTEGGGNVEFVAAPAYGNDGHQLFSAGGISQWTPYVDAFLRRQKLLPRTTLLALPSATLKPPARLGESGRSAFADFLRAAPHKAFAVSANGAYGWQTGRRTVEEARSRAMEACSKHASDCMVVVVDDTEVR